MREARLVNGRWVLRLSLLRSISWDSKIVKKHGVTLLDAYKQALDDLLPDQRPALTLARRHRLMMVIRTQNGADVLIFQRRLMILEVTKPPPPPSPQSSKVLDLMDALKRSVEEASRRGKNQPARRPTRPREWEGV